MCTDQIINSEIKWRPPDHKVYKDETEIFFALFIKFSFLACDQYIFFGNIYPLWYKLHVVCVDFDYRVRSFLRQ